MKDLGGGSRREQGSGKEGHCGSLSFPAHVAGRVEHAACTILRPYFGRLHRVSARPSVGYFLRSTQAPGRIDQLCLSGLCASTVKVGGLQKLCVVFLENRSEPQIQFGKPPLPRTVASDFATLPPHSFSPLPPPFHLSVIVASSYRLFTSHIDIALSEIALPYPSLDLTNSVVLRSTSGLQRSCSASRLGRERCSTPITRNQAQLPQAFI